MKGSLWFLEVLGLEKNTSENSKRIVFHAKYGMQKSFSRREKMGEGVDGQNLRSSEMTGSRK